MKQGDNRKFNILHVISRLPVGGVENMLYKVAAGYDRTRFNPVVCCIREGGVTADKLEAAGIKVHVINRMDSHGFDAKAVTAILRIIKRENISILRTHQYHANLYGRLAGIFARVPVIVPSFHNLYHSPDSPKFHRRLINYILGGFSNAVVAVSASIASDIERYDRVSREKIRVINNGIEDIFFDIPFSRKEARQLFNIPENDIVAGSVGRLTEQKGHRFLIEAAAKAGNISVAIAGNGPLEGKLKSYTKSLGVRFIFPGQLEYDRIPAFLKSLDIFCFPSLWEGLPSSLLEAMASGLPIVASDIPPHREALADAGILIPVSSAGALSDTLKKLRDNPSLRDLMGKKASERAELFTVKGTVKAYEDLFLEILRKKRLL